MSHYPVVWKTTGEQAVVGKLDIGRSGVVLEGGERRRPQRVEIPYSEIIGLCRADERIGDLPAVRLERHPIGTFLIAGITGVGINRAILDELYAALSSFF